MRKSLLFGMAVLALALVSPAQGRGGGGGGTAGGGSGGSGYGGCPPPASPAPAPAPASAPSAGSGLTATPGSTPTAGPGGGVTPGSPAGGSTPTPGRGGVTPRGAGAGRGSRGPYRGGKKVRISSEQSFWIGAVTLPWEGTFLPQGGAEGYDGRELTVEESVASRDAKSGWKMKSLPTIVFVYDPSDKGDMKSLAKVSSDKKFISASHYFNLFRVDVRTIKNPKVRKSLKQATFMVFNANGEKVAAVTKPSSFKSFTRPFRKVFDSDFAKPLDGAVTSMGAVIARRAWVDDEIRRHETVLVDPVTGKIQQNIKAAIAAYKKERKSLDLHEAILVRLQRGAGAAK